MGSVCLQTTDVVQTEATGIVVAHVNAGDDVFVRTHPQLKIGTDNHISSNFHGRTSFAGWKIFWWCFVIWRATCLIKNMTYI